MIKGPLGRTGTSSGSNEQSCKLDMGPELSPSPALCFLQLSPKRHYITDQIRYSSAKLHLAMVRGSCSNWVIIEQTMKSQYCSSIVIEVAGFSLILSQ